MIYVLTVIDPDLGDLQEVANNAEELAALLDRFLRIETVRRVIVEVKQ